MPTTRKPWDKYLEPPGQRPPGAPAQGAAAQGAAAQVLVLPAPEDRSLTALPLVRNWLFAPDRSRLKWRRVEQTITHQGRPLRQAITVGLPDTKKGFGVLTTRHQRAIFVLQRLWQQQGGRVVEREGRRVGLVRASSWELEEALFGAHGGRQKKLVRHIIHELNAIPIHFDGLPLPDGTIAEIAVSGLVNGYIFGGQRDISGQQLGLPWAEIELHPWVIAAWEAQDVKPLDLKVLDQLSSDLARLLYPKLDWLLSRHERAEFRLLGLVDRLGLTDSKLRQPAYRRRQFARVAKELSGAPLSAGGALRVSIQAVQQGGDDKLVARRTKPKKPSGPRPV